MPDPTPLTIQQINPHLLRKQFLLDRGGLSGAEVLRRCIAIQAQYPSAAVDAVILRSASLSAPEVEQNLAAIGGRTARGWSLRGTMHLANAEDWPLLTRAVGPVQYTSFLRFMARSRGLSAQELRRLEGKILAALARQPLSREELHAQVPELAGLRGTAWGLDVKGLVLQGQVLVGSSSDGGSLFYLAPTAPVLLPVGERECLSELARRYARAYGPVHARDFAHWAGIPAAAARGAFAALGEELAPVRVSGHEAISYMTKDDLREALEFERVAAGDCLLAKFDPLLLAYAGGSPLVPPRDRRRVYRPAGQIEGCVVLAGGAAGTWRARKMRSGLQFLVESFVPMTGKERERVEALAAELAGKRRCGLVSVQVRP